MNGHVFQLFEESQKPNQFTTTLDALKRYATLFADPIANPKVAIPSDLQPCLKDNKGNNVVDSKGKPVSVPRDSQSLSNLAIICVCSNHPLSYRLQVELIASRG
jgi:hypothetical protein